MFTFEEVNIISFWISLITFIVGIGIGFLI